MQKPAVANDGRLFSSSFRDAPLGAGPESINSDRGYGFRARSLRSRPGMTVVFVITKALRIDVDLELKIALGLRPCVPRYFFFVLIRTPGASPLVNSTPASSSTRWIAARLL